jgi:hypothetical protein
LLKRSVGNINEVHLIQVTASTLSRVTTCALASAELATNLLSIVCALLVTRQGALVHVWSLPTDTENVNSVPPDQLMTIPERFGSLTCRQIHKSIPSPLTSRSISPPLSFSSPSLCKMSPFHVTSDRKQIELRCYTRRWPRRQVCIRRDKSKRAW